MDEQPRNDSPDAPRLLQLNYPETPTRPWTRLDYADLIIRVILIACFASAAFWALIFLIRAIAR
jgi:hypothetical protein